MGKWIEVGRWVEYKWDLAEIRRMNRTDDEARALHLQCWRRRLMWWIRSGR